MTEATRARPLPGCPAFRGNGTDITEADFVLVVHDCPCGPAARQSATEVFRYFAEPGPGHDNDVIVTAAVVVPFGSPAARLAHQVSADPSCAQRAGDLLRRQVTACPCTASAECPALDESRLVAALGQATGLAAINPHPAPRQPARRQPAPQGREAPGPMRLINPDDTADDLNLTLLRIAHPEFRFCQYTRGGRGLRWAAVRRNGADPGLYAAVTGDLDELHTALAADQAQARPGPASAARPPRPS
jgi:hypothetical protein